MRGATYSTPSVTTEFRIQNHSRSCGLQRRGGTGLLAGCLNVFGNAPARLRSRLSNPCGINAAVTEPRSSGSGFVRNPENVSAPRRRAGIVYGEVHWDKPDKGGSLIPKHLDRQNVGRQWDAYDCPIGLRRVDRPESSREDRHSGTHLGGIGGRVEASILIQGRRIIAVHREHTGVRRHRRPRETVGRSAVVDNANLDRLAGLERPRRDRIDLAVLSVQERTRSSVKGYSAAVQLFRKPGVRVYLRLGAVGRPKTLSE